MTSEGNTLVIYHICSNIDSYHENGASRVITGSMVL